MFKTIKNQKGITLVELLAVMVIVGIIAAISIPAIGNLIENTRKDAFIATAQNVTEAARLVVAQNSEACDDADGCIIDFTIDEDDATALAGAAYIEKLSATTATVEYGGNTEPGYTVTLIDDRYTLDAVDAFDTEVVNRDTVAVN
ncbi:MAG: type II secretion system protein [Culicoidibacterales bacterium]